MPRRTVQDSFRFEPTLWGAIRRYRYLVLGLIVVGAVAGAGINKLIPKTYDGNASLAIPPSQAQTVFGLSQSQDPDQYISEQVTLLQSQQVANKAASIVNAEFHRPVLTGDDISGGLTVTPPAPSSGPSTASTAVDTVPITFSWSGPKIAAAGANAVLTAYEDVRNDTIKAQTTAAVSNINASVAAIDQQLGSIQSQLNALDQQQAQAAAQQQAQQQATISAGGRVAPSPPPTPSAQQQALTLQQNSLNTRKSDLLQRLDDYQVNEQLALSQQPTTVPAIENDTPSNHHLVRYVGLGAVIGLILGTAIAYLLALRRRRFSDRFDPEGLYLAPLLGDIPEFRSEQLSGALPVGDHPDSATAEAYRFVAASLRVIRSTEGPTALAFTSARIRAGKTTSTANVALALAHSGSRVLAVDADFVRQQMSRELLGPDVSGSGLLDVLEGRGTITEVGHASPAAPNGLLTVLTGGAENVRLTGVSEALTREFIATAKESFDFILIDGPPVLQAASATEMLRCSDGVVMVLNHDELIQDHPEVIERLQLMEVRVVGYVYNRAPLRRELTSYYTSLSPASSRVYMNGTRELVAPTVDSNGNSTAKADPTTTDRPHLGDPTF